MGYYSSQVLNEGGTPMIFQDTLANRPAPAIPGRLFVQTDASYGIYRDTGISWVNITGGGGGGSPSAPVNSVQYNNAGAFGGVSQFTLDATAQRLILDGGYYLKTTQDSVAQGSSIYIEFAYTDIPDYGSIWYDNGNQGTFTFFTSNGLAASFSPIGANVFDGLEIDEGNFGLNYIRFSGGFISQSQNIEFIDIATGAPKFVIKNQANNSFRIEGEASPYSSNYYRLFEIPQFTNRVLINSLVNTTIDNFVDNFQVVGTTLMKSQVSAFAKTYGQFLSAEYDFDGANGNTDVYATKSQLYLVLGAGNWFGSETYNANALTAQVTLNGNNGVSSTQPIRAMLSVLSPYLSPGKLDDFRHYEVKQPDHSGAPFGTTIGTIYGVLIADQKNAPGFTITNAWGIYQRGLNDQNYLAGNTGIGGLPTSRNLFVNGPIEYAASAIDPAAGGTSGQHLIIYVNGVQYKIQLLNP